MPFRFQRRFTIAPGFRVNLGKRGVSLSEGVRGANLTVGTRGIRTSLSLPGTGLGWFTQSRWGRGRRGGVSVFTWLAAAFAFYVLWNMMFGGG